MTILTMIALVSILGFLIFVHILGHFVVRRAFSGGDEPMDIDLSYGQTSVWVRIVVVLAGPAANFLLAVLLFWGLFTFVGRSAPSALIPTTVGVVNEGFPAAAAGIRVGDRITAVNREPVRTWEELAREVALRAGQRVRLTVERGVERFDVILTLRPSTRHDAGDRTATVGLIGIAPGGGFTPERVPPLTALVEGATRTTAEIVLIFRFVWQTAVGAGSPETAGGPIVMARMAGGQDRQGIGNLIFVTAVLSINLGVLNLLPLPFLDGERLCFLVGELVRGRPVSLTARRTFQGLVVLGFVVLVLLSFLPKIFRFLKEL